MDDATKLKIDLRHYPVRPHVGVGALIVYKDMLCMVKRKYDPDAGKWAIPGGHLELGEKCTDAAEREALEETGIKTKAESLAGVIDKIVYDRNGKVEYHYVLINYHMRITDPSFSEDRIAELTPRSDAADIRFVPFEEIERYDITDSLRELLLGLGIIKK